MRRSIEPLLQLLARNAAERPDALAIVATGPEIGAHYTWRALASAVEMEAQRLSAAGEDRDGFVVSELPRGADSVIRLLAAHRCGAAILPLDPADPAAYRAAIVARAREHFGAFCTRYARDEHVLGSGASPGRDPQVLGSGASPGRDPQVAWIVFTSGSTGRPKGVCVGTAGILPLLRAQTRAFALDANARVAWLLSPAFDASFSDIGTALYAGATLVPYVGATSDFPRVLAYLHDARITHADLPPALLAQIDPAALPATLRTLIVGGEPCPPHALRAHARQRRVVNVYGPTEATVCVSLEQITAQSDDRPRLGIPLEGVQFHALENELVLEGDAVALGYLDDDARTDARFFRGASGKRAYRTGDRVTESDGVWVFEGRIDRQVKIAGKLVAPEELEAALRALPTVRSAIVSVVAGRLHVDVDASCTEEELRAGWLALPKHLHPATVRFAGPTFVNSRGKRAPKAVETSREVSISMVAQVRAVCTGLFGGALSDDEALPIDSLRRIELLVALEAELGVRLPIDALANAGTVHAIARIVHANQDEEQPGATLVELLAERPSPMLASAPPRQKGAGVFLTGATGFLGARLAANLAAAGIPVRALVRARDDREAHERLARLSDGRDPGVVAVAGDLHDSALLAREAGAASVVVHLAASLRLDADRETLFATNVAPLAPLLSAGTPLVFASSLAVFAFSNAMDASCTNVGRRLGGTGIAGRRLGGTGIDSRAPLQLSDSLRFFGGYAQSKALAEGWLQHRKQVHLLRIGLVVDDSVQDASLAYPKPSSCPLRALATALSRLGVAPRGEGLEGVAFDTTPVADALHALQELVQSTCKKSDETSTIHAVFGAPATLADLYEAFRRRGQPLTIVDDDTFRRAVHRATLLPFERRAALGLLHVLGSGVAPGRDKEAGGARGQGDLFRLTRPFAPQNRLPRTSLGRIDPCETLTRMLAAMENER